jgi:arsenate reductase
MKILFVCQGNTCRSPIAEGLARHYGGDMIEAVSAGLAPGSRLAEKTHDVMEEIGIDLSGHHPRALEAVEGPVDFVVSLCEVIAPGQDLFPNAQRIWWKIKDPIGGPISGYRATRNAIWERLRPLLLRLTENPDLPLTLPEPEE